MSEQGSETQFAIQRIYVKDSSFESPRAPESFRQEWKPKVNMELNTKNSKLDEQHYEVTLIVTITATNESDETVYLAEVQQAGVFMLTSMDDEALTHTLSSFCPNILYPYAREMIDSMVLRGSFPPLMLAPVNFDALYSEALKQRANQEVN
ncbi:MAG: protein-export chaperone SecB [Pseudomonadales bacterium]